MRKLQWSRRFENNIQIAVLTTLDIYGSMMHALVVLTNIFVLIIMYYDACYIGAARNAVRTMFTLFAQRRFRKNSNKYIL